MCVIIVGFVSPPYHQRAIVSGVMVILWSSALLCPQGRRSNADVSAVSDDPQCVCSPTKEAMMAAVLLVVWVATVCGWFTHIEHKNNQCFYGLCQEGSE